MGKSTPEQRRAAWLAARARRELVDGLLIATDRLPEDHGKPSVANYTGCQCAPCRAARVHNNPAQRSANRRERLAERELIDGVLVATVLRPEQHGTSNASNYHGCQCDVCTTAARERQAARRRRRASARYTVETLAPRLDANREEP
jgi:hypothetical protein